MSFDNLTVHKMTIDYSINGIFALWYEVLGECFLPFVKTTIKDFYFWFCEEHSGQISPTLLYTRQEWIPTSNQYDDRFYTTSYGVTPGQSDFYLSKVKYFKVNHPFVLLNCMYKCAKIWFVNSHMYGDAALIRPYMAATNVLVVERPIYAVSILSTRQF